MSGMSGSSLPQRHYCLGRTDICCLSKVPCMNEKRVCVGWGWGVNAAIWVFDSILVLLKSVLIFHHWGFYGTDSIHEKSDGRDLIFQVPNVRKCAKRTTEPCMSRRKTLQTITCPPSLTGQRRKRNDGRDTDEFSSVWD